MSEEKEKKGIRIELIEIPYEVMKDYIKRERESENKDV